MKAAEYAAWLRQQATLKRPFWYGTCGYPCTEELLNEKRKQYPSQYGETRLARYRQDIAAGQICADCVGGSVKWAVWSNLGRRKTRYQSGGCPDVSADGMFEFCKKKGMAWGGIDTMPDLPGVALRHSGHLGVYVGDGQAVEWSGFQTGCILTRVAERSWTHWFRMPWVDYGKSPARPTASTALLGSRPLQVGSSGEDVRALQLLLNELGFGAGGVDGKFGQSTAEAVRRMQRASGVAVDGQYGERSHAALMGMHSESANGERVPGAETPVNAWVRVTGDRVNVRAGAGNQYPILTVAAQGTRLPFMAKSENGWLAVQLSSGGGWIFSRYAEVERD